MQNVHTYSIYVTCAPIYPIHITCVCVYVHRGYSDKVMEYRQQNVFFLIQWEYFATYWDKCKNIGKIYKW